MFISNSNLWKFMWLTTGQILLSFRWNTFTTAQRCWKMLKSKMAKRIQQSYSIVSKINSNAKLLLNKNLNIFKFRSTSFNNSQRHSTWLPKRVRHVAWNKVEWCWMKRWERLAGASHVQENSNINDQNQEKDVRLMTSKSYLEHD